MANGLGTLLFLAFVLAIVSSAAWAACRAVRGGAARLPLTVLFAVAGTYVLLLLGASTLSRERRVPLGTTFCYDDWCATVTGVRSVSAITGQHRLVVVDLRISSTALRVTQRGSDPRIYVIDSSGNWYPAQRPFGNYRELRTAIGPGESFTTQIAASVPTDASVVAARVQEGGWIDLLIPFDEESLLHRKTFYDVRA